MVTIDNRQIKAVLFDMDGVILNSMPYHVQAWKEALQGVECEVCEELLYLYEGAIEPATAVRIFCEHGCHITEKDFELVFQAQKRIFHAKYRHQITPYPEVPHLLQALHDLGLTMAVVTSSHLEIVMSTLPLEVSAYLSHIVTGDRISRRKPHPDPYLAAASALRLKNTECLVVENAPAGIQAAKAAGMECVAITTTLEAHHLKDADHTLEGHQALQEYLLCRVGPAIPFQSASSSFKVLHD
jgi:beta-phosphoglucomutase